MDEFEWLETPEGELYEQALELTWGALEEATVDLDNKLITLPDGTCLGITALAEHLEKQFKMNAQHITPHIVGWLSMGYEPQNLSDSQMETFEDAIDDWIKPFEID